MRGRHSDVDDHEVGLLLSDEPKELTGLPGLADNVVIGAVEEAGKALAQENVVVGDNNSTALGGKRLGRS
jgi:hypothetical protein